MTRLNEHYYYQENLSLSVFNGRLKTLSDISTMSDSKSSFEDIVVMNNSQEYIVKLQRYNRDFEFLRDKDKKKIIANLESKLIGKEAMVRAEQSYGSNYAGEVYIVNYKGQKNEESLADIIDIEIKKMLRANAVKVNVELIHFENYKSIIVRYNGSEKMVQLDLLDTSFNKLNKSEMKALNSFIESNIGGNNLELTIGGILNNTWFSEIVVNNKGNRLNLAKEVKKLISSEIPEKKHLSDRVKIKGLFSSIVDGKTIQIYANDKRIKVEIDDIEEIDLKSPYYRHYLASALSFFDDKVVEVDAEKIDGYYANGDILKKRNNCIYSLAKDLVSKGLVLAKNKRYKELEVSARKNNDGIWVCKPSLNSLNNKKNKFF